MIKQIQSGKSIEHELTKMYHPVPQVNLAYDFITSNDKLIAYSNNPDFIMASKFFAKKYNIDVHFYKDGINCFNDIELIFEDFNKSLDMINKYDIDE
jgi:hypothetical protein